MYLAHHELESVMIIIIIYYQIDMALANLHQKGFKRDNILSWYASLN